MGAAVRRPGFPMFYQSTRGPPTTRRCAALCALGLGRWALGWFQGAAPLAAGSDVRMGRLRVGAPTVLLPRRVSDVFIDDFYTIFMQRWLE